MFDSFISSSTIDAIKQALVPVAEKIGTGAGYVWSVLVKQMFVEGFGFAVAGTACLVLSIVMLKLAFWGYKTGKPMVDKQQNTWDTKGNGYMALCFMGSILSLAFFGLSCLFAYFAIAHFINPDFYALEFLINAVHPAAQQ